MALKKVRDMKYQPNKTLAEALKAAKDLSEEGVIQHSSLSSKHLGILKKAGCLTPVIRGWYLLTKPEAAAGSSTIWYVGFWPFLKSYLLKRFGKQGYCLSADASLDLHTGENHVSRQITVITRKASNQTIELPEETSLLLYTDTKNFPEPMKLNGIYVMPLPLALCRLSPSYFKAKPLNVEIALKMLSSVTEVSRILLENGFVTDAGRLAGAFRAIGDEQKANQIVKDMAAAGLTITEGNPFENHKPVLALSKIQSPYAGRIEAMWKKMREAIIQIFPKPPGVAPNKEERTIRLILEKYKHDAYHSLSIEGYEVTEDLIQKIADGSWSPETDPKDQEQINAMAAKGYYEAFQSVIHSVRKIIADDHAGEVFEKDLQDWYRALFSPSVQSGILRASDLAGYRNGPVYIKGARHVPPGNKEAVVDSMETLFELLKNEEHPAVRAILGHFIFVYIHPYMDGNGRIGRFILNLMFVSGGYPWTVIRTENRPQYMQSLEAASSDGKIEAFAEFVYSEMKYWSDRKVPATP
jgi:hypothetical protein